MTARLLAGFGFRASACGHQDLNVTWRADSHMSLILITCFFNTFKQQNISFEKENKVLIINTIKPLTWVKL
jgi:hypothetical protein